MAIRSDHLVVSLTSDQGHYTFLYRYTKHNREGGRKNQQTRAWVSSKRKKWEVYVALLCSSPCICSLSRACILRETSTKPIRMLTHHFVLVYPASVGKQVLAVVFVTSVDSLLCPADILSVPPSADCVPLWTAISSRLFSSAFLCQLPLSVFSGTFVPPYTSGLVGELEFRHFWGVSRQDRQRDHLSGTITNGNEIDTHRVTERNEIIHSFFFIFYSSFRGFMLVFLIHSLIIVNITG